MAASTIQIVDFSGVKDGGNFNKRRIPAGDYLATITKVEDAKAKDDVFQYLFSIKINKHSASVLPYYCKLQDNQLWKLRNIFIAAGKVVPKKRQKVDTNTLVGKIIGVTIEDAEYQDQEQSEIAGVFPAAEIGEAPRDADDDTDEVIEDDADDALDDLDDAPEATTSDDEEDLEDEPEEEAEEAEEGDEWDAITDRLELRKALKKVAPDVKTSSSQSEDDIRDLIRLHNKPKLVAKAAPAKAATRKPSLEVSDDELEELDIDAL